MKQIHAIVLFAVAVITALTVITIETAITSKQVDAQFNICQFFPTYPGCQPTPSPLPSPTPTPTPVPTPTPTGEFGTPRPLSAQRAAIQPAQAGCNTASVQYHVFLGTNTQTQAQQVCQRLNQLPVAHMHVFGWIYFSTSRTDPLLLQNASACGSSINHPNPAMTGIVIRFIGTDQNGTRQCIGPLSYTAAYIIGHEVGHTVSNGSLNPNSPSGRFAGYVTGCTQVDSNPQIAVWLYYNSPTGYCSAQEEAYADQYQRTNGGDVRFPLVSR